MMHLFIKPNTAPVEWKLMENINGAFHSNSVKLLILKLFSYFALAVQCIKTQNRLSPKQQHRYAASQYQTICSHRCL